jgi:SurA N-terminal domain
VLRTSITLTAAGLAGVLMLSACGSVKLGAAAVSSNQRISSATVTAEVNNLNQAYQADKAKIQLQFAKSQMPQEVLSWLLRFQVREQMANRYGITVTPAQVQDALASISAQAKQSGVTTRDLAVANGVPPDQLNELGRYVAIQDAVLNRLDGGKLPTANAALTTLSNKFDTSQCVAAKSLSIQVNPQYGALDYRSIGVVAAPNKLSAPPGKPSPSPTGTAAPQLTPHC